MRRYKVYLATGRVLEIEAKSHRIECGPVGGDRLTFRGEKNQVVAECWLAHVACYAEGDAVTSEEK